MSNSNLIVNRVLEEISSYDIRIKKIEEIDDIGTIQTTFTGSFLNNSEIDMCFTVENGKVIFESLSESWYDIDDTRHFWITFMSLLCENN